MTEMSESERTELLDWVSACQSSYHIDSTPGHRFGGLGSHLQENRDALVEYVNELLAARTQPAQEMPMLSDQELLALWTGNDERFLRPVLGNKKIISYGRAIEAALLAKIGGKT